MASIIDEEVKRFIDEQYARVKALIEKYRPHMDAIVAVLLEKETLDRKDVDAIIAEVNAKLGLILEDKHKDRDIDDDKTPPTTIILDGGKVSQELNSENPDPPQDPKPGFKPKFA